MSLNHDSCQEGAFRWQNKLADAGGCRKLPRHLHAVTHRCRFACSVLRCLVTDVRSERNDEKGNCRPSGGFHPQWMLPGIRSGARPSPWISSRLGWSLTGRSADQRHHVLPRMPCVRCSRPQISCQVPNCRFVRQRLTEVFGYRSIYLRCSISRPRALNCSASSCCRKLMPKELGSQLSGSISIL